VLAGGVNLAWFAMHALVRGEFWWAKLNVAAGWFYGASVYHAGCGRVTLTGASLLVVAYGLAGTLFAAGWEAFFRQRGWMGTALIVLVAHLTASYLFWPSFDLFARLWFPWSATAPAGFVLFLALLRFPWTYRRLLNEFAGIARVSAENNTFHPDPTSPGKE
jgi:hypothetical protein